MHAVKKEFMHAVKKALRLVDLICLPAWHGSCTFALRQTDGEMQTKSIFAMYPNWSGFAALWRKPTAGCAL
jgi:hypothetical protein